jgi:hypothetical protein
MPGVKHFRLNQNGTIAGQSGAVIVADDDELQYCCCYPKLICEEVAPDGFGWDAAEVGYFIGKCATVRTLENGNIQIAAVFRAADSLNCGGSTDTAQYGKATVIVNLAGDYTAQYTVDGNVETVNLGFDESWIKHNGDFKVLISCDEELGESCTMQDKIDDLTGQAVSAGINTFEMNFDTKDGRWHQDLVHTFAILLVPNP